jgi:hypothetical protein
MGMATNAANSLLSLLLRAQNWANVADNAASSPLATLYIGLHTGALTAGDAQNVNEATFGSYARKGIGRNTTDFAAPSSKSCSNATLQQFSECTSGTNTITDVSLGVASSGATDVWFYGSLSASRTISSGIRAQFAIGGFVVQIT